MVAAVAMTWLLDGRVGVGVLLRRFLVWRVGLFWYASCCWGRLSSVLRLSGWTRCSLAGRLISGRPSATGLSARRWRCGSRFRCF